MENVGGDGEEDVEMCVRLPERLVNGLDTKFSACMVESNIVFVDQCQNVQHRH
jgi:hypothetical protein